MQTPRYVFPLLRAFGADGQLFELHGMYLEEKGADFTPQPHTKLLPIFVPASTPMNADILLAPIGRDGVMESVGDEPDWKKKIDKLYWVSSSLKVPGLAPPES